MDASRWRTVGTSSLTKAELRLLTLLPTQLTHREIGERLCLSRHTVKAQAQSIYRKLGVSSRGQAVQRPTIRPARGVDLMVHPTGNSLIAVYYASAVTRSR